MSSRSSWSSEKTVTDNTIHHNKCDVKGKHKECEASWTNEVSQQGLSVQSVKGEWVLTRKKA